MSIAAAGPGCSAFSPPANDSSGALAEFVAVSEKGPLFISFSSFIISFTAPAAPATEVLAQVLFPAGWANDQGRRASGVGPPLAAPSCQLESRSRVQACAT